MQRLELLKYNPSKADFSELEQTFVGREDLVQEILNDLKRQIKAKSNQNYLFKGPRGIGKTNLLQILFNRIRKDDELSSAFQPLKFAEEEYSIITLRDFFIKILEVLNTSTTVMHKNEVYQSYKKHAKESDDELATESTISFLRNYARRYRCKLLVMIDNFDLIFGNQIKQAAATHRLRDVLMNNNFMIIFGTISTYFKEVMEYGEPFYNFFKYYNLEEFNVENMEKLLIKHAKFDENHELVARIPSFHNKFEALRHLTGGNPRLVLMLYQLITRSELPEVKSTLNALLDDLTPYYKLKLESLAPQARKVVDTLARMDKPASPTEISKQTRINVNQVSSIIKRLYDTGYVTLGKQARRKNTYYILSERLFRIWHQMRYASNEHLRLPFLVDFISIWYSKDEFEVELERLELLYYALVEAGELKKALKIVEHIGYLADASPPKELKDEIFDSVIQHYIDLEQWDKAEKELNQRLKQNLNDKSFDRVGLNYYELGNLYGRRALKGNPEENFNKSCDCYAKVIEYRVNDYDAWNEWGTTLGELAQIKNNKEYFSQAFEKFQQAVSIKPDFYESLANWGHHLAEFAQMEKDENLFEQAFEKFQQAVNIKPDFYEAFINWGMALSALARMKNHEAMFKMAFKKFENATHIDSKNFVAFHNWGNELTHLAYLKNEHLLFQEANDKFNQAISINPDCHEALNGKGICEVYLNNISQALHCFEQAYQLARKLEIHEAMFIYLKNILKTYIDCIKVEINQQNMGQIKKLFNDFLYYTSIFKRKEDWRFYIFQLFYSFLSKNNVTIYFELEKILKEHAAKDELKFLFSISKVYEYWQKNDDPEVLDRLNPEDREVVEDILAQAERIEDKAENT